MPQLIRHRTIVDDPWTLLREATSLADLPDGTPAIVPLPLWRAQRAVLVARGDAGVWLAPCEDPRELAPDVARLPLIAIDFPQSTDGRGYSHARLLRQRYRFTGELRAIGDVQRDQLYFLCQCGFDAFAIPDARDAVGALRGLDDFGDGYQSSVTRRARFARQDPSAWPRDFGCARG
ncbi:MAG: DUF934 domain-containing protein [Rudaea sp.]